MRVVFLDIDGVLCTWASMQLARRDPRPSQARFCRSSVDNLNRITDRTGAVIVLSSAWRCRCPSMSIALGSHIALEGVTAPVIGQTPRLKDEGGRVYRGNEIQAWLDDTGFREPVESFVILDDDSDMVHLSDRLVHVVNGMGTGLLPRHVEEAVAVLERRA